MTATLTLHGTFTLHTCTECAMGFAVPQEFDSARQRDHKNFYCPRGHSQYYPGESDLEKAERLRKNAVQRMEWAESRAQAARDQADASERSARAYRGHLTRMKNQIANGVCPVNGCRRHFDAVQAHIETVHPGWAAKNPDALA